MQSKTMNYIKQMFTWICAVTPCSENVTNMFCNKSSKYMTVRLSLTTGHKTTWGKGVLSPVLKFIWPDVLTFVISPWHTQKRVTSWTRNARKLKPECNQNLASFLPLALRRNGRLEGNVVISTDSRCWWSELKMLSTDGSAFVLVSWKVGFRLIAAQVVLAEK
jgi:hypothetical protein